MLRSLRQGLFADGLGYRHRRAGGLVNELSAGAPTVIILDDLHWADDASLIVWQQLAAAIGQLRLLLIGTGSGAWIPAGPRAWCLGYQHPLLVAGAVVAEAASRRS